MAYQRSLNVDHGGNSRGSVSAPTIATRQSLLERLRHRSDQQSWHDFFNRYWGVIYSTARKAGLSDAEAQEVVQETVIRVADKIAGFRYDRKVASFKTWLLRITRYRILNQFELRRKDQKLYKFSLADTPGGHQVEDLPDPAGIDLLSIWEQEWQTNLYAAALEAVKNQVRPAQYQLFDLYVIQQWPVRQIVRALNVSATNVYVCKFRITHLLRKEIRKLEKSAT